MSAQTLPRSPTAWLDGHMTRYADPRRCPDCLGPIAYGTTGCPRCGLPLGGETAQRLFATLTTADELLLALRAEAPALATVGASAPPVGTTRGSTVQHPPHDGEEPAARRRSGLSAASVPKILLGLGAGCVLVAALVFLAVTWSLMGVAGRTATLVGFTAIAGVLAGWMTRRGQRGAAEALTLVALGLLTLDVLGARTSGWFGDIGDAGFVILLGGVLAAAGATAATAVRRTAVTVLTGAEVVAALGVLLATIGVGTGSWTTGSADLVIGTLLAAAATVAAHTARLKVATIGAGVVSAGAWTYLAGDGLERAFTHPTLRELWLQADAWPVLVAAGIAAGLALLTRLPLAVRVTGLSLGTLLLAVLAVAPVELASTPLTLAVLATLSVVGTAAWFAPRPWGLAAVAAFLVGGLWLVVAAVVLVESAVTTVARTAALGWAASPGDDVLLGRVDNQPAPWLLPVLVLALVAMAVVLRRGVPPKEGASGGLTEAHLTWVASGVSLAAGAALLGYQLPVWVTMTALLVAAVGYAGWWLRGGRPVLLATAATFLSVALLLSAADEVLSLVALTVALASSGAVHLRSRGLVVGAAAGTVLVGSLAGLVWTALVIGDVERTWQSLVVLVVLAVLAVGRPHLPLGWLSGRDAGAAVEAACAVAAVPVCVAGVAVAADPATWTAIYLTVAGAAASATALLRRDRRGVGWAGGALLAAASWVRLWDIGVDAPEAYTLPTAVALVMVGVWHLRNRPESGTTSALSAGLGIALVPSLLWSLDDPATLRTLLLGGGCLVLVLLGLRLRWTAPLVWGAAVGALLVLRLAAPFIDAAVPRWLLIGFAGALLISLGVSWERRLGEARAVLGYVRALR